MAKRYNVTRARRLENTRVSELVKLGIGPGGWPLKAAFEAEAPTHPVFLDFGPAAPFDWKTFTTA